MNTEGQGDVSMHTLKFDAAAPKDQNAYQRKQYTFQLISALFWGVQ